MKSTTGQLISDRAMNFRLVTNGDSEQPAYAAQEFPFNEEGAARNGFVKQSSLSSGNFLLALRNN